MTITEWPKSERPREKLIEQGANTLSDAELLAIFLRTGCKGKSAVDLGRELISHFGGIRQLLEADSKHMQRISGLGMAKFIQLQAILEMSKRYLKSNLKKMGVLNNTASTKSYLSAELRHLQQEVFACLFLNAQHEMLAFEKVFFGTVSSASVYPREIVKKSLAYNAAAVILAHNHPSGHPEPSTADLSLTSKLVDSLKLVDVRVLDHIIIGDKDMVSFVERGLL